MHANKYCLNLKREYSHDIIFLIVLNTVTLALNKECIHVNVRGLKGDPYCQLCYL